MIESNELHCCAPAEFFEAEEVTAEELSQSPKKVSFFERFHIYTNDVLLKLTAGIRIDNSFPGNHWHMR